MCASQFAVISSDFSQFLLMRMFFFFSHPASELIGLCRGFVCPQSYSLGMCKGWEKPWRQSSVLLVRFLVKKEVDERYLGGEAEEE